MNYMTHARRQRGATLIVGLIMLVLITLMMLTAFMLSSSNLKSVGNMQHRAEAIAAANVAIEQVISSDAIFITPAAQTVVVGAYSVAVAAPRCLYTTPVVIPPRGGSADPKQRRIATRGNRLIHRGITGKSRADSRAPSRNHPRLSGYTHSHNFNSASAIESLPTSCATGPSSTSKRVTDPPMTLG